MAAPAETENFHIVGIGASAGGLDSLERLFTHLPADTGMAFVVLQHLSPDFKSVMDELLARRTPMRIVQAVHDLHVEPNTVYLLPPMKEMIIRQRRLLLNDRDPRHGLTLPIDMFLRSLAHDIGQRAAAVILSGSGSDGSRGVQEIRKAGGTVFCESPDTAQFNGMPLSAMRSGAVDHVLPPEEIALAVAALDLPAAARDPDQEISDDDRGATATFTVYLPLALDPRVEAETPPARRSVRSVVLVEDQADARRMLQILLESEGVDVYPAANGLEGVKLIEERRPDLALVDLGLPIMSGFDLARQVRRDPRNAAVRLVALSGYGQESDVQASLAAGFDEHLTKPPDHARLERILKGIT